MPSRQAQVKNRPEAKSKKKSKPSASTSSKSTKTQARKSDSSTKKKTASTTTSASGVKRVERAIIRDTGRKTVNLGSTVRTTVVIANYRALCPAPVPQAVIERVEYTNRKGEKAVGPRLKRHTTSDGINVPVTVTERLHATADGEVKSHGGFLQRQPVRRYIRKCASQMFRDRWREENPDAPAEKMPKVRISRGFLLLIMKVLLADHVEISAISGHVAKARNRCTLMPVDFELANLLTPLVRSGCGVDKLEMEL